MSAAPENIPRAPENFRAIITDLVRDLDVVFVEYAESWKKWRADVMTEEELNLVFQYCLVFYPARFFDILYKNEDIFKVDSGVDTMFLPNVEFKALYFCEGVSKNTQDTLWKYLQLILFSAVQTMNDSDLFGDSLKMFENIDAADLKTKLEEAMQNMSDLFGAAAPAAAAEDVSGDSSDDEKDTPPFSKFDAGKMHEHINTLLNGKIGSLAKELAEDVSREFSEDMFDESKMTGNTAADTKTMLEQMMKNPAKMMNIVKKVSGKLDERMKSGDISQEEIMKEATDIMGKMKDIPGLGSIEKMLKQFGRGFGGAGGAAAGGGDVRIDTNAINRMSKHQQMKEKLRTKLEAKKRAQVEAVVAAARAAAAAAPDYIDPSLLEPETPAPKNGGGGAAGGKKKKGSKK